MEDLNEDNSLISDVFVDVVVDRLLNLAITYKRLLRGLRYYQLWVFASALTKGSLSNDADDSGENAKQQLRRVITFLFTFVFRKCTVCC